MNREELMSKILKVITVALREGYNKQYIIEGIERLIETYHLVKD